MQTLVGTIYVLGIGLIGLTFFPFSPMTLKLRELYPTARGKDHCWSRCRRKALHRPCESHELAGLEDFTPEYAGVLCPRDTHLVGQLFSRKHRSLPLLETKKRGMSPVETDRHVSIEQGNCG